MAYVIKRYSNRKLYDTQESRYVTLDELEELIRAGKEISVVDVSNGDDLTSVCWPRSSWRSGNHRAALPTVFHHQLIKHGQAWQDFVQKSCARAWKGSRPASVGPTGCCGSGRRAPGGSPPPGEPPAKAEKRAEPAEADALREEVSVLREQLRTLEERLEKKREK